MTVNIGTDIIGTVDSRQETRAYIFPSSDFGPSFDSMDRMIIAEQAFNIPTREPVQIIIILVTPYIFCQYYICYQGIAATAY